jgi:hypothetical protein
LTDKQVNSKNAIGEYLGPVEKLRRSLILITSGATGGYYQSADQPRSGLNSFIILILNPFRVLSFVFFVIQQFHWWLLKLNPFRISNSN